MPRDVASTPKWGDPPPACRVCGEQTHWYSAPLCKCCAWLRNREDNRGRRPDKAARERALQEAWDRTAGAFRCYYTGVALIAEKGAPWPHPRYLDYEHQTPGDESDIVVTCSVVNQMKGVMSASEFEAAVLALENAYRGGTVDDPAAARLVTAMKTDLAPDALQAMVLALAEKFRTGTFDESVFSLIDPGFASG